MCCMQMQRQGWPAQLELCGAVRTGIQCHAHSAPLLPPPLPPQRYVADNGGIAMEQAYPYEGEQNWCRAANSSMEGHFDVRPPVGAWRWVGEGLAAGPRICFTMYLNMQVSAGTAHPSSACPPPVALLVAGCWLQGYLAVESRDELSLMEAVWKYGPVAIAVDPGRRDLAGPEGLARCARRCRPHAPAVRRLCRAGGALCVRVHLQELPV